MSLNRLTICFSSLEKTSNLVFFTRKDFYKITQPNMKDGLKKGYNEYGSWFCVLRTLWMSMCMIDYGISINLKNEYDDNKL
jgi:hypothetical protein